MHRILYSLIFCFALQVMEGAERCQLNNIEFFVEKPEGKGPFPVLVMVHGYQEVPGLGGRQWIESGMATRIAKQGIVAVAISIPGFGGSEGQRDFAGPMAQNAVIELLDHLKTLDFVDSQKVGLYGVSRGAITAACVGCRYPDLALQILSSGRYDFKNWKLLDYYQPIMDGYLRESGGDWLSRSALYHVDHCQIPTLLLHGALDAQCSAEAAQIFHNQLEKRGVFSRYILFPHRTHFLNGEEIGPYIFHFLSERFFDQYGIGICLTPTNVYPQIERLLVGYPAEKCLSLRLGDILLAVAPDNEKQMVDVRSMAPAKISALIVGKKGSSLRLKVAHLDGLEEEVALVRG